MVAVGGRCIVDRTLAEMDAPDEALFRAYLTDPELGDEVIEFRMWDAGYVVSDTSIRRWRLRNGVRTVWAR